MQARIDHPHIVPVYEAGELEGHLFIAMRLVRGPTLKGMITARELDPRRSLQILRDVADALDTAHESGLIHRDVKPSNVLVGRRDHAFLCDFGLTKLGGSVTASLTKTGHVVGTLDYIAPEQIRGGEASAASDVYAFAAVMYETLTGQVPFPRSTEAALLYAHISDPVPDVSVLRPDLPETLNEVIASGLAKFPGERPSSPLELVERAEAILAGTRAGVPALPARGPRLRACDGRGHAAGATLRRRRRSSRRSPTGRCRSCPPRPRPTSQLGPAARASARPRRGRADARDRRLDRDRRGPAPAIARLDRDRCGTPVACDARLDRDRRRRPARSRPTTTRRAVSACQPGADPRPRPRRSSRPRRPSGAGRRDRPCSRERSPSPPSPATAGAIAGSSGGERPAAGAAAGRRARRRRRDGVRARHVAADPRHGPAIPGLDLRRARERRGRRRRARDRAAARGRWRTAPAPRTSSSRCPRRPSCGERSSSGRSRPIATPACIPKASTSRSSSTSRRPTRASSPSPASPRPPASWPRASRRPGRCGSTAPSASRSGRTRRSPAPRPGTRELGDKRRDREVTLARRRRDAHRAAASATRRGVTRNAPHGARPAAQTRPSAPRPPRSRPALEGLSGAYHDLAAAPGGPREGLRRGQGRHPSRCAASAPRSTELGYSGGTETCSVSRWARTARPRPSSRSARRPSAAATPFLVYRDPGRPPGPLRCSTSRSGSRSGAARTPTSPRAGTPASRARTRSWSASAASWVARRRRALAERLVRQRDARRRAPPPRQRRHPALRPHAGRVLRPARDRARRHDRGLGTCMVAANIPPAQRRVLVALCRPLLATPPARLPASNNQIAEELYLSLDAVKTHLRALSRAFGVDGLPQNQKRIALAERALAIGAVTSRDVGIVIGLGDAGLLYDGRPHPDPRRRLVLGRAPDDGLPVDSERASRRHARVEPFDGGYRVVDLDSKNGTYVNGEPIRGPHALASGDIDHARRRDAALRLRARRRAWCESHLPVIGTQVAAARRDPAHDRPRPRRTTSCSTIRTSRASTPRCASTATRVEIARPRLGQRHLRRQRADHARGRLDSRQRRRRRPVPPGPRRAPACVASDERGSAAAGGPAASQCASRPSRSSQPTSLTLAPGRFVAVIGEQRRRQDDAGQDRSRASTGRPRARCSSTATTSSLHRDERRLRARSTRSSTAS